MSARGLRLAFRLYIAVVLAGCLLLANVELWRTIRYFGDDWRTLWGLLAHNPNQFLFLALFMPIAAVFIGAAAIRLFDHLVEVGPRRRALAFWLLCTLGSVTSGTLVAYLSGSSAPPDFGALTRPFAARAVEANRLVLNSVLPIRPTSSHLKALEDAAALWSDDPERALEGYDRLDALIRDAIVNTHRSLASLQDAELAAVLEREIGQSPAALGHAIMTLQIVLDRHLLARAAAASDRPVLNDWLPATSTIELFADVVIIGHFFGALIVLGHLKARHFTASDLPPELLRVCHFLYIATILVAVWVPLRLIALMEISLVFGGVYGTYLDWVAVIMLVVGVSAFLLAISTRDAFKTLTDAAPILGALAGLAGIFFRPVLFSQLFGSLAEPKQVGILLFAFFLLFVIWCFFMLSRPLGTGGAPGA